MISATDVAEYMPKYIELYRREYERFILPPPNGGGYPALRISPYLSSPEIHCHVAPDGVIITAKEETGSVIPENIRMFNFCPSGAADENELRGVLPSAEEPSLCTSYAQTRIVVDQYKASIQTISRRLFLGGFELRPNVNTQYWSPLIFRGIKMHNASISEYRYIHYLDFYSHTANAAWDRRGAWMRVAADVRFDFAHAFSMAGRDGATISPERNANRVPHEQFFDRLLRLKNIINEFERLLNDNRQANESVFHEFIKNNSILLDVYGETVSKPRFEYPEGESPLDKKYVEPDFVIYYPNTNQYKLVEIEKPSKRMATKQGHATKELSQPMFQISEWWTFISKHPQLLQVRFPGINALNCQRMVVMSRSEPENYSPHSTEPQNKELLRNQFGIDELLTYDDLLNRAKLALVQLAALGVSRT